MKKNVVFFTNCQGPALGKTLLEDDSFSLDFEILGIPPVHAMDSDNRSQVESAVANCDVFIYQEVHESPKRLSYATSDYVKSLLKKEAITISIPSIYFDAFFPHLGPICKLQSPLNFLHDYIVAYCWYIGLSVDETIMVINHPNLFLENDVNNHFARSVENLRLREEKANLDVKVSDFIINNYKESYLMHQFNHPTRILLNYVARKVANILGVRLDIKNDGAEYLGFASPKVLPSIKSGLGITFSGSNDCYNSANGEIEELDFILGCFSVYNCNYKIRDEIYRTVSGKSFVANNVIRVMPEVITTEERRAVIQSKL